MHTQIPKRTGRRTLRRFALHWALLSALLLGLLLPAGVVQAQDGPVRASASDPSWVASYFNNTSLEGSPALVRSESELDHNWGHGSPDGSVQSDFFSARWTRYLFLEAATYRFTVTVDDGVRLFIDDQLVIDQWRVQSERTFTVDRRLSAGHHLVRLEFFEQEGEARVRLRWEQSGSQPPPSTIRNWRGEYFNNRSLSGDPVVVRDDERVSNNWGVDSPIPGTIQADNFSIRWTRSIYFDPGNYRFTVSVDDGVRLWVNNAHIIDEWREQPLTTFNSDIYLPGGNIPIRVEYFEATAGASIQLTWQRIDGGGDRDDDDKDDDKDDGGSRDWYAQYFNNRHLDGSPALERFESRIDHDWGYGSPDSRVNVDNFTARYTLQRHFSAGKYRFVAEVDDGVRVYVDGRLKLDKWFAQARTRYSFTMDLSRGNHKIVVEYLERTALASFTFNIRLVEAEDEEVRVPIGNIITCVPPQPDAYIKLYRLDGNNRWYSLGRGIGSIHATGFLKIDGLPVDTGRFGEQGEPYAVQLWVGGRIVQSTGDFPAGQPEFRVRPFTDNYTPWGCSHE